MGNVVGSRKFDSATMAAGKVVLSDGRVQNLEEETTVAEIMLENPQHLVVEFDPSSISFRKNYGNTVKKKLTPLPADKTLEPGKIYLVLPVKRSSGCAVKPSSSSSSSSAVMTSEELRKMLFSATVMVRSSFSYYEGILPWFTTRNYNNNSAADAMVVATSVGRLETEEEGRPEFLSRQLSGRGWKPSLDPIKEKKPKKKIQQLLF